MLQDLKDCAMNFSLVFSANNGKVSCIRVCLHGNLIKGFYFKTNLLRNGNLTKDKNTNSLLINETRFSNYF
jgi:hypothetical protein